MEDKENALFHQGLAQSLYQVREYDKAVAESKKALVLDKTLSIPHLTIGIVYSLKGMLSEAEVELKTALENDPENFGTFLALSYLFMRQKRFAEAEAMGKKAISLRGKDYSPHYFLSSLYLAQRRNAEAKREIRTAFALNPSIQVFAQLMAVYLYIYPYLFAILVVGIIIASIATAKIFPLVLVALIYLIIGIIGLRAGQKTLSISSFLTALIFLVLYVFLRGWIK